MNFNEFIGQVQKSIREVLGKSFRVEVREVMKNNGVLLQGIVIRSKDETISPTIYLNAFFEEYRMGKAFGEIVFEIVRIYEQNKITDKINLDFFLDYNTVKGRIFEKVINYEKNKKLLENVPYIRYMDLAVVCYYAYMNDFFGRGSIQIETGHLDKWGISEEELFAQAKRNTLERLGMELKGMSEVLFEMVAENMEHEDMRQMKGLVAQAEQSIPMYIMTLKGKYFGAACIFHKEMLRMFADRCGKSFFILPSSIHELILVPDSGREKAEELKKMVQEVNAGHVAPEERLSNHIYYFDFTDSEITML